MKPLHLDLRSGGNELLGTYVSAAAALDPSRCWLALGIDRMLPEVLVPIRILVLIRILPTCHIPFPLYITEISSLLFKARRAARAHGADRDAREHVREHNARRAL